MIRELLAIGVSYRVTALRRMGNWAIGIKSLTINFIAVDMPRPFVSCPQDMDVELPARQNTIRVTFPQPKSNMDWWR